MTKFIIKIVEEQHFIEGNRFNAFLMQQQGKGIQYVSMPLACCVKPKDYLDLCDNLNGLKTRLTLMGNEVEIITRFDPDPNFETEADADEYLANKGE